MFGTMLGTTNAIKYLVISVCLRTLKQRTRKKNAKENKAKNLEQFPKNTEKPVFFLVNPTNLSFCNFNYFMLCLVIPEHCFTFLAFTFPGAMLEQLEQRSKKKVG